jgi:transporter family protein
MHPDGYFNREIHLNQEKPFMREWIVPALGTFIFWGLWGFLPKLTTRYINPLSGSIFEAVGVVIVGMVVLVVLHFKPETHPLGISLAILTGIAGSLGALVFLVAVARGKVSLVVSFTALYPLLSIVLAVVFLKESFSLRQGAGVVLGLVAMLLIAA